MPTILDRTLLERFNARLEAEGALIVNTWAPGLDDDRIDALLRLLDIDLPDEARTWWHWHRSRGLAAIAPNLVPPGP